MSWRLEAYSWLATAPDWYLRSMGRDGGSRRGRFGSANGAGANGGGGGGGGDLVTFLSLAQRISERRESMAGVGKGSVVPGATASGSAFAWHDETRLTDALFRPLMHDVFAVGPVSRTLSQLAKALLKPAPASTNGFFEDEPVVALGASLILGADGDDGGGGGGLFGDDLGSGSDGEVSSAEVAGWCLKVFTTWFLRKWWGDTTDRRHPLLYSPLAALLRRSTRAARRPPPAACCPPPAATYHPLLTPLYSPTFRTHTPHPHHIHPNTPHTHIRFAP